MPDSTTLPPARSARWTVVGLLTAGIAIGYLDRVNLSVALVEIGKALDINAASQGVALSAFYVSYALLQIPAGWVVDRYGIRTPYALGFVIWSAASIATAYAPSLFWLCALRGLVGVGEAISLPASMRYVYAHFAERERGLALAVLMSGVKIGPAIAFPIASSVMGAAGWRTMFVVTGLVPLLWLPAFAWSLRNDSTRSSRVMPDPSSSTAPAGGWVRSLAVSPAIWGLVIGTFSYLYFFYFCLTWLPAYLQQQHGLSLDAIGWYASASFLGPAVMTVVGGRASDWLIARGRDPLGMRKLFILGGIGLAMAQPLSVLTGSSSVMLGATMFALCGLGLVTANNWALIPVLVPDHLRGRVVGIQNTAGNLAGVAAPAITGWLVKATGSFDAPVLAIGVWLGISIAAYGLLVRAQYAPKA